MGNAGRCLTRAGSAQGRSLDRKSTRLNSSHSQISYAVFCLKKKKKSKEVQLAFSPLLLPGIEPMTKRRTRPLALLIGRAVVGQQVAAYDLDLDLLAVSQCV